MVGSVATDRPELDRQGDESQKTVAETVVVVSDWLAQLRPKAPSHTPTETGARQIQREGERERERPATERWRTSRATDSQAKVGHWSNHQSLTTRRAMLPSSPGLGESRSLGVLLVPKLPLAQTPVVAPLRASPAHIRLGMVHLP